MGHPKKSSKRYDTPMHPWQADRIAEEAELVRSYGLKNKRELWRAESILRKHRRDARRLLAELSAVTEINTHTEKETNNLLSSLKRKGILKEDGDLDDVLALKTDNILGRRLQTLVRDRGVASSMKQARQLIVHGHIAVAGRRITIPSYIVTKEEEPEIGYYPASPIANELHPVRPSKVAEVAETETG